MVDFTNFTNLNISDIANLNYSELTKAFAGLIAGLVILAVIIGIAVYIYQSFAYMSIGKKAKVKNPGLAWIPFIGPIIIAYETSDRHWWPWLLLIGLVIPIVNILAAILFAVFVLVWKWDMLEEINRPGWWILISLIPVVGMIAWWILLGVAAWGEKR